MSHPSLSHVKQKYQDNLTQKRFQSHIMGAKTSNIGKYKFERVLRLKSYLVYILLIIWLFHWVKEEVEIRKVDRSSWHPNSWSNFCKHWWDLILNKWHSGIPGIPTQVLGWCTDNNPRPHCHLHRSRKRKLGWTMNSPPKGKAVWAVIVCTKF